MSEENTKPLLPRLERCGQDDEIKQALAIIEDREKLADEGKGEMPYGDYREIKKLLKDVLEGHEERLKRIEARLRNTPHY